MCSSEAGKIQKLAPRFPSFPRLSPLPQWIMHLLLAGLFISSRVEGRVGSRSYQIKTRHMRSPIARGLWTELLCHVGCPPL
jgi:hypothetical protein